jgi:hypothetical protein
MADVPIGPSLDSNPPLYKLKKNSIVTGLPYYFDGSDSQNKRKKSSITLRVKICARDCCSGIHLTTCTGFVTIHTGNNLDYLLRIDHSLEPPIGNLKGLRVLTRGVN